MFTPILTFLAVLSVLVLVHELGHFIMAKRAKVWVEEFGFGLPPRIFGITIGETIYSINWLPFGGFVRLHGEQREEGVTKPRRAFLNKNKRTRISIIVAGVVMNFLLAIVCFGLVYSFSGIPRETGVVRIVDVASGSPAQNAGLVVGDLIKKVDSKDVVKVGDFIDLVNLKKGKRAVLEIQKAGGTSVKTTVSPRETPPAGEGPLGVTISTTEVYFPPVWQRPFYGIYYGFKDALFWGQTVVMGFVSIFQNLFKGVAPKDIAGPVGIFAVTTEASKIGFLALINFVGVLSVNLAVLNIIPFPALDGGRLLFILIESVIGKKILPKVEATAHSIGMIILLLLILAVTANDIQRLIAAGGITGFIDSIGK